MILYGIHYSPWSLRARWALRHHHVDYEYREYVTMVMAPTLRVKVRDFRGPITVPILIDGDVILRDSVDIARYAEERGDGAPLFSDSDDVVRAWAQTADQIANAGRIITTAAVLGDSDAMKENVPPIVPRALRGVSTPIVALGASYLRRKYAFEAVDQATDHMRAALERVANRLVESDSLGETFGWPDIAVCSALQFVRPADGWVRLGAASRRCWTRAEIADQFADVLDWRDGLVAAHVA